MGVQIATIVLAAQDDTSGLARQLSSWKPERIRKLALLYKVEGEYQDGSRERARNAAFTVLREHGLEHRAEMVTVVGCEGLATPFGYVLADIDDGKTTDRSKRLAIGLAHGPIPADDDLDRAAFKLHVAKVVTAAVADAELKPADVVTAIVNTPQPMRGDIGARGRKARAVAALGAGIGLGEIEAGKVRETALMAAHDLFTRRVQTFAGPTVKQVEAIVIGNRAGAGGDFIACSTVTSDLADMRPLKRMLVKAGLTLDRNGEIATPKRIAAMIVKSGIPADGVIHGRRTTLFEPGLAVEKHVRAAQSGLMAGLLGTTCAFNTFDPIHQCPVGGSAACAIVRAG